MISYSEKNKEKICNCLDDLRKIYRGHSYYVLSSEEDRGRIINACGRLCASVDASFDARGTGILLLLYGDEFLRAEFAVDNLQQFIDKALVEGRL